MARHGLREIICLRRWMPANEASASLPYLNWMCFIVSWDVGQFAKLPIQATSWQLAVGTTAKKQAVSALVKTLKVSETFRVWSSSFEIHPPQFLPG